MKKMKKPVGINFPIAIKALSLIFQALAAVAGFAYVGALFYLRARSIGLAGASFWLFAVLGALLGLLSLSVIFLMNGRKSVLPRWAFFANGAFCLFFLAASAYAITMIPKNGGYYKPLMLTLLALAAFMVLLSAFLPLYRLARGKAGLFLFFADYVLEIILWCVLFFFSFFMYAEAPGLFLLFLGTSLSRSASFLGLSLGLPDWGRL
jgi:hypothetical protein